jgi:hypothetical protein
MNMSGWDPEQVWTLWKRQTLLALVGIESRLICHTIRTLVITTHMLPRTKNGYRWEVI